MVRAFVQKREFLASNPAYFMMLAIVFFPIAGAMLKTVLGRLPGSLTTGAILGILGWFLFGVIGGLFAAVIGFILAYANAGSGGGGSGGGWSSGGSSGGSSSSSSGWSGGGGGGFGGGGASGRW